MACSKKVPERHVWKYLSTNISKLKIVLKLSLVVTHLFNKTSRTKWRAGAPLACVLRWRRVVRRRCSVRAQVQQVPAAAEPVRDARRQPDADLPAGGGAARHDGVDARRPAGRDGRRADGASPAARQRQPAPGGRARLRRRPVRVQREQCARWGDQLRQPDGARWVAGGGGGAGRREGGGEQGAREAGNAGTGSVRHGLCSVMVTLFWRLN